MPDLNSTGQPRVNRKFALRHALGASAAIAFGAIVGWSTQFILPEEFKAESTYAVVANSSSGSAGLGNISGLANLTGLAGAATGRLNLDQYVALIQNIDSLDAVIDRHALRRLWKINDAEKARKKLRRQLRVWVGQKDQLIRIEVAMPSAELASTISNQLGALMATRTAELASAEAKTRRQTLEPEVRRAQAALQASQQQLVRTQIDPSLARADSRSIGDQVTKLTTELGSIEVRLAATELMFTSNSAEVRQLIAARNSLRDRLSGLQRSSTSGNFSYMEAFRDFKYQEAVLDILTKQYESARIDEVKGGQYIHIVQTARPPERPQFPDPPILAATGAFSALILFGISALVSFRLQKNRPG